MALLTEELRRELAAAQGEPLRLTDPSSRDEYVVIRADVFDRMRGMVYDDSPWTPEEREALAWEAGKHAGWDDPSMDIYDQYPERS